MRKIILISMFFCVLHVLACPAWSLTVGSTDVGAVDTLIAYDYLGNSGDATELAWVKSVLGNNDITMQEKTNTPEGSALWSQTKEDERVYAFDFININPEYFLVKTAPTDKGYDHFLFRNDANFSWGVIDLDFNAIDTIKNVGKLSHINEYNGTTSVPEPATLLFLGFGLIGAAGVKRKFHK